MLDLNPNVQFYLLAFFIGGIPFGWVITQLIAKIDIRKFGSGGIGATNVLRVLGSRLDAVQAKRAALATVILDASKGAVLVLLARALELDPSTQWAIAVLSVFGHCFSPYLLFEGGKGVATAFGVLLVLMPIEALIGLGFWLISARLLKISSLSSLLGMAALVQASFLFHESLPEIDSHAPVVLISLVILYKHIPNILRLFHGQEEPIQV